MGRTKAHPALCVLQIPKSDYCSGILSALYLISNILYFLLRPVVSKPQSCKIFISSGRLCNWSDEWILSMLCIIQY